MQIICSLKTCNWGKSVNVLAVIYYIYIMHALLLNSLSFELYSMICCNDHHVFTLRDTCTYTVITMYSHWGIHAHILWSPCIHIEGYMPIYCVVYVGVKLDNEAYMWPAIPNPLNALQFTFLVLHVCYCYAYLYHLFRKLHHCAALSP